MGEAPAPTDEPGQGGEGRYAVAFKKSALKELARLPKQVIARVTAAIVTLADDPRPKGCKKLRGYDDLWRIRVGDYRVIYTIEDAVLTVEVLEVVNRKDAY